MSGTAMHRTYLFILHSRVTVELRRTGELGPCLARLGVQHGENTAI